MTRKKKIALAISAPIIVSVVAFMSLIFFYGMVFEIDNIEWDIKHKGWTKIDFYEDRWGIYIADDVTVDYDYCNQGGWFGDGENYTVCKLDKTPQEFLRTFDKDFDISTKEKYIDIIERIQNSDIDKSKIVIPDDTCRWRMKKENMDTIVFAYDARIKTLYIAESLI